MPLIMKYPPNNIRPSRNGPRMIASNRSFDSPPRSGVALAFAWSRADLEGRSYTNFPVKLLFRPLEFLRRHSDFFSPSPLPDGQRYHSRGGWRHLNHWLRRIRRPAWSFWIRQVFPAQFD